MNFTVTFKSGVPIYEQVVFAVKKAIVSRQLKPGDRFPSVREISKELKINPNTAQKVISTLVQDRLLEIQPGVGSAISSLSSATTHQRKEILETEIDRLVVESKKLLIKKGEVLDAIKRHWNKEPKRARK